jgi:hypothetical protein
MLFNPFNPFEPIDVQIDRQCRQQSDADEVSSLAMENRELQEQLAALAESLREMRVLALDATRVIRNPALRLDIAEFWSPVESSTHKSIDVRDIAASLVDACKAAH